MSITIYYSGRFKRSATLSEMINELRDIAEVQAWDYHIFVEEFSEEALGKPEFNEKLYGISISPPACEPLWMCFLSNGQLSSPVNLQSWEKSKDEKEKEYLASVFTKTQYAGAETHKVLINLLRYINSKYLEEFELVDESGYWETGDEKLMEEKFSRMNALLDKFVSGLKYFPMTTGESIESYMIRLMKKIHKNWN